MNGSINKIGRGFTIFELAIVLAVIGILTAIGISGARALRQAWEVQDMRLNTELALRAVEGFTVIYKRLPSEKEFYELNLPKNRNGKYIYHINPALIEFSLTEQYCAYIYSNSYLLTPDTVKEQDKVSYAYAVDFEFFNGLYSFRNLKRYSDFLVDLRCKRGQPPVILTQMLAPVRIGSSYSADIVFQGGTADDKQVFVVCIGILNEDEHERAVIKRFFGNATYFSATNTPIPVCSAPADERKSGEVYSLSSENRVFTDNLRSIKLRIAVSSLFSEDNAVTVKDYTIHSMP